MALTELFQQPRSVPVWLNSVRPRRPHGPNSIVVCVKKNVCFDFFAGRVLRRHPSSLDCANPPLLLAPAADFISRNRASFHPMV